MKYRWLLAPAQPLPATRLAQELKLPSLLAQCLLNRGLTEPGAITGFLEPKLKHLADPFLLPNMEAAVDRLFQARERRQPVVIFGDYDVDGVTSTALLLQVLRPLGWTVTCYLPHRMDDGYGLTRDALDRCLARCPAELLLAVDCGSTSVDSIDWLRQRGIDTLVLDHHQVSTPAPAAIALVNPWLPPGTNGPNTPAAGAFRELCSVGLSFKLAHALVKRGRATNLPGAAEFDLRPLLDLVALGTIADIVPLSGENRILAAIGLQKLSSTTRPGLVALKKVAQCPEQIGVYETGFLLGPRLNAAGRLETAENALRLLLATDPTEAMQLASELDAVNRERQAIEKKIASQAITGLKTKFNSESDFVIVEGEAPWHIGVVGIVAARVLREFYRPTIILGGDGAQLRGSGRSIDGFDLASALSQCADLLLRHGGHAMAAGVALVPENLDAFRLRLNALARASLTALPLKPPLHLDAEVGLEELTPEFIAGLDKLEPHGQQNPPIQFQVAGVHHQRGLQRIGTDKQHVKMWVADELNTVEAVWWGAGAEALPVGAFDLAFCPQVNTYQGQRRVQLKVLDWRPHQPAVGLKGLGI